MVRTLLFGTALQTATCAAITMAEALPAPSRPSTNPHVVPPNTTHLDN